MVWICSLQDLSGGRSASQGVGLCCLGLNDCRKMRGVKLAYCPATKNNQLRTGADKGNPTV